MKSLIYHIRCKLEKDYHYRGAFFIYNRQILHQRVREFIKTFPGSKLFFSVKSLSNISILKELTEYEPMGLDVVSGGEIQRGILAGFPGERMVFAGVGKTEDEIRLALRTNIKSIHVESLSELKNICRLLSEEDKTTNIALRLNPNIPVSTHKYIETGKAESKFGIDSRELEPALQFIESNERVNLKGLHLHIGSQIMETKPYENAFLFLMSFLNKYPQVKPDYLSLGGGFGVDYRVIFEDQEKRQFPLAKLAEILEKHNQDSYEINFEPGRFISAPVGILVSRVVYIKPKDNKYIAITDAGMSELIRPILYEAEHEILNVSINSEKKARASGKAARACTSGKAASACASGKAASACASGKAASESYDVVGPICETGDFLAKDTRLYSLQENDDIVVTYCGAYAACMSSNYNSRPLVPEILIEDDQNFRIIRKPQKPEELFSQEIFD